MDKKQHQATSETSTAAASIPAVAVIMRSKNEQPYTKYTLEKLFTQTFQQFTLYNVDSGSTDGTLEVIQRFNPHPENIKTIAPEDYLPGRVLNHAISETTEPIIVLLNADCVPMANDWLEQLLQPILEDRADAITGRQIARQDAYFIVRYDLDRAYGRRNLLKQRYSFFSAAACAFKRELWEQEKFPEEGWGEDFVWAVASKKKEFRFDIAVEAVVEHSHNYTLKTLYKREKGHGIVHYQALKDAPSLFRKSLTCLKQMLRDILYACRHGQFMTIPYNLLYRAVFHWAHYKGQRAGYKQQGFSTEFFRE